MTMQPGFKRPYEFPESFVHSTGAGPDFPDSAGDRERGKFRPSEIARRTVVAVSGDDGRPVTRSTDDLLEELLVYQKAIVLGLSLMTGTDLLNEVS